MYCIWFYFRVPITVVFYLRVLDLFFSIFLFSFTPPNRSAMINKLANLQSVNDIISNFHSVSALTLSQTFSFFSLKFSATVLGHHGNFGKKLLGPSQMDCIFFNHGKDWRVANVVCWFKNGLQEQAREFLRPVSGRQFNTWYSILPALDRQGLFNESQHNFVHGKSCLINVCVF